MGYSCVIRAPASRWWACLLWKRVGGPTPRRMKHPGFRRERKLALPYSRCSLVLVDAINMSQAHHWTFHNQVYMCVCVLSCFSRVWLFAILWTVAHQAALSRGILQPRILEWVAMPSSRGPSWCKGQTLISCISCIAGRFFTHWATWETQSLS